MSRSNRANTCDAIDRTVSIDLPGYGIIPKLFSIARLKSDQALSYSAGNALAEVVRSNKPLSILTGFPVPSPLSPPDKPGVHSDGPVGVVSLLRVLVEKFGLNVSVITDLGLSPIIKECLNDATDSDWTREITIEELPINCDVKKQCEDLLALFHPSMILASEKPGHNKKDAYHTAGGKSLTPYISHSDVIFDLAREKGIPTIAIGDLGNDVGMGNIEEEIRTTIPSEAVCNCPCKSGIVSDVKCDHLIVGTMCDWGLYGLMAYLAIEFRDLSIVPKPGHVGEIMRSFARASKLSDERDLMTDGIPYEFSTSCLETLRGIVQAQLLN